MDRVLAKEPPRFGFRECRRAQITSVSTAGQIASSFEQNSSPDICGISMSQTITSYI
jgi:hypothetical protein